MNGKEELATFFTALRKLRGGSLTSTQVFEANKLIERVGLEGAYKIYGITEDLKMSVLSYDQWTKITPKGNPEILKYLNIYLPKYDVSTKEALAMFLANGYVESMGFTRFRESFAYRPETLLKTFKSRVRTLEKAKELCEQGQEAIANFLYDGRYGNGFKEGWKYRGGGIFQTTFKDNYVALDTALGKVGLVKEPNLIVMPEFAVRSALYYWNSKGLSNVVAKHKRVEDSLLEVRKAINGGTNGLDEVALQLKRMKNIVGL